MGTLAALKRRIKPGTRIESTTPGGWAEGMVRPVARVQTNAITMSTPKDGELVESWMYWPAAKFVTYDEATGEFSILPQGDWDHRMDYRIVEDVS